jgi:hypothetical protein
MQLIRQQILVPENHTLQLSVNIPDEIPTGLAEMVVMITPTPKQSHKEALLSHVGSLVGLWESEKDSVTLQRELRNEWD